MDQDGSASGTYGTTALGSMAEAAGQMPRALEALLADSMPRNAQGGETEDVRAHSMLADTADAMFVEDGDAQSAEADSTPAAPGVEPGASGSTEAAPADGHPPQMAVLASLDQVCMLPLSSHAPCLQHAHLRQVCMLLFTVYTACKQHAHTCESGPHASMQSSHHLFAACAAALCLCQHG